MKLDKKGQSTKIAKKRSTTSGSFSQLEVTLQWSDMGEDVDFDLAVMYKPKGSNDIGLVWPLNLGESTSFPFMKHSGDEAGDDSEEQVFIEKAGEMDKIWIFVWEYGDSDTDKGGMLEGIPARFQDGTVSVVIEDDQGNQTEVSLATDGAGANCCCIAILDCTGEQIELNNTSSAGLIKELADTEQLMAIANGETPKPGSAYE